MPRGPDRRKDAEARVRASRVPRYESRRNNADGRRPSDAQNDAAPRQEGPDVSGLDFPDGEDRRWSRVHVQVVSRLPDELGASEPRMPVAERQRAFEQARVRRQMNDLAGDHLGTGIHAVGQRRGPDRGAGHPVVGRRGRDAIDVASRLGRKLGFSRIEMRGRDLERQPWRRHQGQSRGDRVERTQVQISAILVGLPPVEHGHLCLPALLRRRQL